MIYEDLYFKLYKDYKTKDLVYKNYNVRDLYYTLEKKLNSNQRIQLISGLRGIGKTSLLLHLARPLKDSIYLSLDNPLLKTIDFYDFCKFLIEKKGVEYLFLDEIHTLKDWNVIIKSIYDTYQRVHIIASGSSALGLQNLDRRGRIYNLTPLTFKEYLRYINKTFDSKFVDWKDFNSCLDFVLKNKLERYYNDYIYYGGFVFSFDISRDDFISQLYNSILKSIKEDAPMYSKITVDKIFGLEKILVNLSLSQPGELSISSLCTEIGLSKEIVYDLLNILEKMDIIKLLRTYSRSKMMRVEAKLLFKHPNIRFVLAKKFGFSPYLGAMREEFALMHFLNLDYEVFIPPKSKKNPDFQLVKDKEKFVVEIGGSGKTRKQLDNKTDYVLKDENLIVLGLTSLK